MNTTPFERDIAEQADALRAFAQSQLPRAELLAVAYERIVLTGMGSSHYAALPSWRRLVGAGRAAWWVDSAQLLDTPGLVTPDTLLVVTSQSGSSAEIVAVCAGPRAARPAALVAVTNDSRSQLATAADLVVALHSGVEASVSTKSYLNTLAAHQRLTAALADEAEDDALSAAKVVDEFAPPPWLSTVADDLVATPGSRLVFVGFGDDAATAFYAGLIAKESAKIPAEGFAGGAFRHGPLELAGPGLTAVLFGGDPAANRSLRRLARDLADSGAVVICVADVEVAGAARIALPPASVTGRLVHGALVAQYLAVAIAHARGIVPGLFTYGRKVTTAL